jgi:secondary thiamine-phosphate synthase enzyme
MAVHTAMLRLATRGGGDIVDLSPGLAEILRTCDIARGVVCVFVEGSTAAITTMEHEPGGVEDLRAALDRLLPASADYAHNRLNADDNAHAHLRASLVGPSVTMPLADGRLALGTWQQVVLLDFDTRPRDRRVHVQVLG